jgi:hypothetical protein
VLKKTGKESYRSIVKLDDGGELNIDIEADDHIDDYDELDWEINFQRNGQQSMTGEGDALRIMATVFNIINQFVKKEKPKYMSAAAGKEKGNKKKLQGREKLYKRLLIKNLGRAYNISTDTSSSGTMFNMVRKR